MSKDKYKGKFFMDVDGRMFSFVELNDMFCNFGAGYVSILLEDGCLTEVTEDGRTAA